MKRLTVTETYRSPRLAPGGFAVRGVDDDGVTWWTVIDWLHPAGDRMGNHPPSAGVGGGRLLMAWLECEMGACSEPAVWRVVPACQPRNWLPRCEEHVREWAIDDDGDEWVVHRTGKVIVTTTSMRTGFDGSDV